MNKNKRIYLDYNATTPLSGEVFAFYVEELKSYANGSSIHEDGRKAAKKIERIRSEVAVLINADAGEIIFTSGGSESNNTVFNSLVALGKQRGKNTVVTTAIEHPCVIESSKRLAEQFGMNVKYLSVDGDGLVKLDQRQR